MTGKSLSTVLLTLCINAFANAQTTQNSNIHIGFVYPLSTNGHHAAEYTNAISLHAISGVSYSEIGFCASGIASIIKDSIDGVAASGIANITGNKATGVQAAGIINYTLHQTAGVQAAGFINVSGGIHGVQAAGFANVSTDVVTGLQAAGFANTARSATTQTAGFINNSDSSTAQFAGFMNITRNTRGLQAAGFANISRDTAGTQVAGFINIARKVKGMQVSGFINIADSSDYPIGLINLVKNGEKALGAMTDETGTTFITFRSGGHIMYGLVGIGYNGTRRRDILATQAGIGMHIPLSHMLRINSEVTAVMLSGFRYTSDMEAGIKVLPAVRMGRMEVFAGPSVNYALSSGYGGAPFNHHSMWTHEANLRSHDIYIGFQGGIQFHF